jgi:putative nucleotidyltransferase with HDIG domain
MIEDREAGTVLVVADDAEVRSSISTWLEMAAYRPLAIGTGVEALEHMHRTRLRTAAIVVRLGHAEGIEFLRKVRVMDPCVGAVLVGGDPVLNTPSVEELCGGLTMLGEPYGMPELLTAVAGEVRRGIQRTADMRWRGVLDKILDERARAIEHKLERFAAASLEVLVTSLEARDAFMSGHSVRVAQLSASLANALGHPEDSVEAVRLAGRLHDIGMLVISDRVVNREGPLSPAEFDQVRQHTLVGHQLLQPYPHLADVARFVRGHHERWDGTGYPDGLAGEEIPWGARIIAVVETYDALVTQRSYRREILTPEQANTEVKVLGGKALDPAVCAALSRVIGGRQTLEFVLDPGWEESLLPAPLVAPA